jgi:hypothetical protein
MEFRYLGFDQQQNARVYRFDGLAKGEPTKHFLVKADLALFLTHRIGIQEGPTLCANKLAAEMETHPEGDFNLTEDDLRAHAVARTEAEARKAGARKAAPHRNANRGNSPWRGTR